jgi:HPt (histidine-containing phosphotransfer) domain-containing protein
MDELKIVNKAAALERLDADEELYNEVIEVFFEDTPIQLGKLHKALDEKVISEVTRISHSLKSAAGNIGAERLSAASFKAEKSAKTGSLEGLDVLVKEIQREFDELALFLKRN